MKVAIMQPYFFPYIGYFQLIGSVDLFVVYDNIKYTKKGWINRNRMLKDGKDVVLSLPLKNDSDFLDVRDRELAIDFNRDKLLSRIRNAYLRAPFFAQTFPLIEQIIRYDENNLFRFLYNAIIKTCLHLGVVTDIRISSDVAINHNLKNQDKVLALCAAVGANSYVNTVGGMGLYKKQKFLSQGIELRFIRPKPFLYAQFDKHFVPDLSIIDVMMFNPLSTIKERINSNYELILPDAKE